MKVPMFVQAAALCIFSSTPAHAYVISCSTWKLDDRSGARGNAGLESLKKASRDAGASLRSIGQSLTTTLRGSKSQSANAQHDSISNFVSASRNATSRDAWPTPFHDDPDAVHNGKAALAAKFAPANTFPLTKNFPDAQDSASDNDFWWPEFMEVKKALFENADQTDAFWRNDIHEASLPDTALAQPKVRTAVPEPASLGMIVLGLSALMLSRHMARYSAA